MHGMRRPSWLLLIPLASVGTTAETLANFVYLNDRLELHPRISVGGRYDSNVDADTDEPQDELAAIGAVGLGAQFAWSETTTLTADMEARAVITDRPEDRYRNQGQAELILRRHTTINTTALRAGWTRSDEPDDLTGERLLVDTWAAEVSSDLTGLVHRLSGSLGFHRSDYQEPSRSFDEDDRDENSFSASVGYGFRLAGGDEVTLRTITDRIEYDDPSFTQNSTGIHGLAGWNRQVSEAIHLSIEGGVEYRRYERSDTRPADDAISPTWQVSGHTVTVSETTWSLTLSGGLQDSVVGNPALEARAALGCGHPLTDVWSLHASVEGYNLHDLESVANQPKDERWTGRGIIGTAYHFRPGLSSELDGGYEYSDSDLRGDYDRVLVQAGLTARF